MTSAWAVLLLILWTADAGQGQVYRLPAPSESRDALPQEEPPVRTMEFTVSEQMFQDNEIVQTGCTECQSNWIGPLPAVSSNDSFACNSCGGGCAPGQRDCDPCTARTRVGRFAYGLYRALCCPDPCYEPKWLAIADSAFFVEAARPQTQQRLRWDAGLDAILPDRAEYFWARADGHGKGPSPTGGYLAVRRLTYHELSLYTEVGSSGFSLFTEVPYRSLDPTGAPHAAGFADMNVGTKTLMFDCELLQLSFQFRTHIPMSNTMKGLGTGHVSLEPSLLVGLYLGPETYLQGQVAEWIPIAGDKDYAGAILHYHLSLNHVLWRPLSDVPLIGNHGIQRLVVPRRCLHRSRDGLDAADRRADDGDLRAGAAACRLRQDRLRCGRRFRSAREVPGRHAAAIGVSLALLMLGATLLAVAELARVQIGPVVNSRFC